MKEISRRNFLKGAAASALSVAAMSKLGGFS
ncbi:MAG: twin-arginine translocation signal domain-containing protein, partial [Clostridia bacterium]|nr:twin-arginine translocation signal domain-containing protein [Clostridia bacterium]